MKILLLVSDFIIPVIVLLIVVFGCLKRVNLYEAFSDGAKEGLKTVVEILPTLIGLLVAVEVVRAGGLLECLTNLLKPLEVALGFPAELAPLTLVRLVSSSGSIGAFDRYFYAVWTRLFFGACGFGDDELYRNCVLYHEFIFYVYQNNKNKTHAFLCIDGKYCRRFYGRNTCGTDIR